MYAGDQNPGARRSGRCVGFGCAQSKKAPTERGELVCTMAFPSMPIGFWDDATGARYNAAYFERFDGVWAQGDFASWTDTAASLFMDDRMRR